MITNTYLTTSLITLERESFFWEPVIFSNKLSAPTPASKPSKSLATNFAMNTPAAMITIAASTLGMIAKIEATMSFAGLEIAGTSSWSRPVVTTTRTIRP